jgi:hypothetical protein
VSDSGEMLLVAVDKDGGRVAMRSVPPGDNPYTALADLWLELNQADPPQEIPQLEKQRSA